MFDPGNIRKRTKRVTIRIRKQNFIKNQAEPLDQLSHDTANKDESILVEDSPAMRRRFRLIAQRIRIINVYGVNKKFRD